MIAVKLEPGQVARDMSTAIRRIGELTGFDKMAVLKGEAGIILKTCAGRTKVRTDKQVDQNSWIAILGKRGLDVTGAGGTKRNDITVNAGIRGPFGRVWVRTREGAFTAQAKRKDDTKPGRFRLAGQITPGGQGFRPMNYHWRNAMWTDIQEIADQIAIDSRRKLAKGRRSSALGRQSWVQVADALGIDLNQVKGGGSLSSAGIDKARRALAVTGVAHKNGTGIVLNDRERAQLTLINRLPHGGAIGFDRLLLGVMNGRAKYFFQSYAKGAFDTQKKAAAAYPWMRVTTSGVN